MRLAAQCKAGFYPASPSAIGELAKHLYCRAPNPDKPNDTIQVLDPCAGEGLAIKQIAAALGVPNDHVYAVELDAARTERIKENIPGCNLLGPASFMGVMITGYSFGLTYVNPPFDNELGGGKREEQTFCERAAHLLVPHGIMVLVCPIRAFIGNRGFIQFFDSKFEDIAIYKFPDGSRPYNEIVVIGKKRRQELPMDAVYEHGRLHQLQCEYQGYMTINSLPALGGLQPKSNYNGNPSDEREEQIRVWEIPLGWKPNTFKKTQFTDEELTNAVDNSPLGRHLKEVVSRPPDRPPLPLGRGHLGLMLASGKLDGPVEGPHGIHIVRGTSYKVQFHNKEASKTEENPETGAVTTRTVFSERPVTMIRAVDQRGVIKSLSNEPQSEAEEEEDD